MTALVSNDMIWLPDSETPLLEAALAYAAHGLRVIPVWGIKAGGRCGCGKPDCKGIGSSAGKHPIGRTWQKLASTESDIVRDARRAHPEANIGLAMGGAARLVAMDVDGEKGRKSLAELEANVAPLPVTLTSTTGRADGGEHRIWRVPPHLDIKRLGNRSSFRKMGIDTRIDGGQIVAAPSLHVSGAKYRWSVKAPIADIPDWLFEALAAPIELVPTKPLPLPSSAPSSPPAVVDFAKPYIRKVLENAAAAISASQPGQRNSLLHAKACTVFEYFVGEGLDHLEAWRALGDAGRAAGLADGEISSVLSKAWRRAQGQPRKVPPKTPSPAPTASTPAPDSAPAPSSVLEDKWERALDRNLEGYLKKTLGNVITILSLDPRWRGVIAYDSFAECEVTTIAPPVRDQDKPLTHSAGEWSDDDATRTAAWLGTEYLLDVAPKLVEQAIVVVAKRNVVHPVRDYLLALKWDGENRLDAMLPRYFGTHDNEYTHGVSVRWMISAVARIFEPGCQADCTLVLESKQHGTGKSTSLELLASKEWYSCTGLNIGDKDSYQCLRRKWIYELGELTGVRGRELNRTKNFLSERVSNFRASYGRRNRDVPRQCIFAATTNESEYLEDKTGNRRFWPVKVRTFINRDLIIRDRDQLWAEAYARYKSGEPWHVNTPEFRALCEAEQAQRVQDDPWEPIVAQWLIAPWVLRHDPVDGGYKREPIDSASGITTTDVLLGALKKKTGDVDRADQMRVAEVLRSLGWERTDKKIDGLRRWFRQPNLDQPLSFEVGSDHPPTKQPVTSSTQPTQPLTLISPRKSNEEEGSLLETPGTRSEVGQVGLDGSEEVAEEDDSFSNWLNRQK